MQLFSRNRTGFLSEGERVLTVVKLTTFLLAFCCSGSARSFSQTISVDKTNAPLTEIFREISKQSDYTFAYARSILRKSKPVTIKAVNVAVEDLLKTCLQDQPLGFKIINHTIVITKKKDLIISPSTSLSAIAKVTGKVTGSNGEPLSGATVTEKDTRNAITTKADGTFEIEMTDIEHKLVVSYVGYETKELSLNGKTNIQIALTLLSTNLGDVVVIGYGSQRKTDLTGSVATIKTKEVEGPALPSFEQALQGRVSGVQVAQTGGQLDGRFNVVVRGIGSLNSGTQPLYVVDGVPLFSAALSTVSMDNIESISILKDASASAIYGSRAANGVVIITTKTGKANTSNITFSAEGGFEKVAKYMKMLNSEQQRQMTVDAFNNSGLSTTGYENPDDPVWKVNNNWQKLLSRTAYRQKYSLGFYGGSEKTQFGLSADVLNRQGVLRNTNIKSFNARLNIDHRVNERFKISGRLSGSYQTQKVANTEAILGSTFSATMNTHSFSPLRDSAGNYTAAPTSAAPYWGVNNNPLAELEENEQTIKDIRLLGSLKMEYTVMEGLIITGSFGGDILSESRRTYLPVFRRGVTKRELGSLTEINSLQINWISDLTIQYQRTFNNKHFISALLGGSVQEFSSKYASVTGTGTTNNLLDQLSNQTTFSATGGDITSSLASTFVRANYYYDDRYLFTATVRRDGSSKFPEDRRYGTFPSVSVGWRVSKEKFYHSTVITDLKLRASYGFTGNQEIPAFAYITKAAPANYVLGNTVVLGNAAVNLGTSDLKWETSRQFDAGIDIEIFNGRVFLTADFYEKRSKDLLVDIPLPSTTGVSQPATVNVGSIKNSGIELSVSSKNTLRKLRWTTDFNISFNKNQVLDIGKNAVGEPFQIPGTTDNFFTGITNLTEAGRPIGAFYMYLWDGIWQLEEKNQAAAFGGAKPGDMKYRDVNGDGKFTTADKTFVDGSPQPRYFGGITNNFEFKNFGLSIFINGSGGNKKINTVKFTHGGGWPYYQGLASMTERWTPTNPSNTIPAANQLGNSTFLATQMSTYFLQNASFLRLKNISLSYSLSKSLLQKAKLTGLKFTLSAYNLLTFTQYEGYDAEALSKGNQLSAGIDYAPYPLSKIYTLSIQAAF